MTFTTDENTMNTHDVPSMLVFGAHPDDCDLKAGGLAALYVLHGFKVRFVSVTNGDVGHHEIQGAQLAERRKKEAENAGDVLNIDYHVLDFPDGQLVPSLDARLEIIRQIREYQPDLILVHRPNDYHPDHRYTSQLIQDAAFSVTVPGILPSVKYLKTNPIIMYLSDHFQKPTPFQPDVIVDIGQVINKKLAACACHESQFYEWLPYNGHYMDEMLSAPNRETWLYDRLRQRFSQGIHDYKEHIVSRVGHQRARDIKYVEAFETCEYGSPLTEEARKRLFPFAL